jgi:hypothetical protein
MQSKLCLVLALVVLVGALAVGNPFLSHGSPVMSDGRAEPFSEGGSGIAVGIAGPTGDTAPAASQPAASQPAGSQLVSMHAAAPNLVVEPSVCCPDENLRDLVVRVRHDHAGLPVWELRDGRFVRENPHHEIGQPLVVLVDGGVLDADSSLDTSKSLESGR